MFPFSLIFHFHSLIFFNLKSWDLRKNMKNWNKYANCNWAYDLLHLTAQDPNKVFTLIICSHFSNRGKIRNREIFFLFQIQSRPSGKTKLNLTNWQWWLKPIRRWWIRKPPWPANRIYNFLSFIGKILFQIFLKVSLSLTQQFGMKIVQDENKYLARFSLCKYLSFRTCRDYITIFGENQDKINEA